MAFPVESAFGAVSAAERAAVRTRVDGAAAVRLGAPTAAGCYVLRDEGEGERWEVGVRSFEGVRLAGRALASWSGAENLSFLIVGSLASLFDVFEHEVWWAVDGRC